MIDSLYRFYVLIAQEAQQGRDSNHANFLLSYLYDYQVI